MNGTPTAGLTREQVYQLLQLQPWQSVQLSLTRGDTAAYLDLLGNRIRFGTSPPSLWQRQRPDFSCHVMNSLQQILNLFQS